jgi:hypothetical protein
MFKSTAGLITMIPDGRVFEYGIVALLGAAAIMVLGVWSLVADSGLKVNEGSLGDDEETMTPNHPLIRRRRER